MGAVTQRLGESYRVDIGSAHYATLDALAFEGATKRSKPNLKVGAYSPERPRVIAYLFGTDWKFNLRASFPRTQRHGSGT